ncbi:hypothetical protein [Maricaulis sp.]|uniref:hypothetical protein n=1 Tax=Maricaulis sp. TaxID=1486257 RepID=UPI003A8D6062
MNVTSTDYLSVIAAHGLLVYLCAFLLSAVSAILLVGKTSFRMRREQFFAHSSGVGLAAALLAGVWRSPLTLYSNDGIDLAVALTIMGFGLLGGWLGLVGVARSYDAFGSKRWAFLAFVPLVNFILIFVPSRVRSNTVDRHRVSYELVAIGLVFVVVANWAATATNRRIDTSLDSIGSSSSAQATVLAWQIRRYGLPDALTLLASYHDEVRRIDAVTELSSISAEGTVLIRHYTVSSDSIVLPFSFTETVRNTVCQSEQFLPIYAAGGTVREQYQRRSGENLVVIDISTELCAT